MSAAVASAPDAPTAQHPRRSRLRDTSRKPALSAPGYWALALCVLGAYLVLWLTHFQYVYGWLADDVSWSWATGQAMLADWRNLFPAEGFNNWQVYFLLVLYWPLKLGISLPSYPLPMLGDQTGQFRFLLLCAVLMHAGALGVWAAVAPAFTTSRLAALVSLVLLASSPTFALWSPQPESRLLGLPFACLGVWLLLRVAASGRPRLERRVGYLLAGTLFGVAASIHYTSLYLLLPVCIVFWGLRVWRERDPRRYALDLTAFVVGVLWLPTLAEAISYFVIGLPFERGPLMGILALRNMHVSPWTLAGNLAVWAEVVLSQFGLLLLAAIALGWVLYLRSARAGGARAIAPWVIGLSIPLALLNLAVVNTMPFLRQTSFLQPFLFLGAGLGTVALAERLAPAGRARPAVLAVLLLGVGAAQWGQANSVFAAQQGVGRALEWAYTHKGDHPLAWLPVGWLETTTEVQTPDEIAALPADAWLVSYFPMVFIDNSPSLRSYLAGAGALAAWPSLYATDTARAEHRGYGFNDFRTDPVLRAVQVVDVGALRAAMQGPPLTITAVTADSVAGAQDEAVNVFDGDRSPDGGTAWLSADTPGPHQLDFALGQAVTLGGVDVVWPGKDEAGKDQWGSRGETLAIQVRDAAGGYQTVWRGADLAQYPLVAARWEPRTTTAVRLIVERQAFPTRATDQAVVEEIVVPGYQIAAPPPTRPLPPLVLEDLRPTPEGLVVAAQNPTPRTVLVHGGARHTLRPLQSGELLAAGATLDDAAEWYLTDALRRSNSLTGAPILRAVRPASTPYDTPFDAQPDGSSLLRIETDRAAPRTVVLFDSVVLETRYEDSGTLTAVVPPGFLANPGRHTVVLRDGLGESNTGEFLVTERATRPPVLRAIEPAVVLADTPFNARPDGSSTLAVVADELTRATTVMLDGVGLATQPDGDGRLSAAVPASFLTEPGEHRITVRSTLGESNALSLVVAPKTTDPPTLVRLAPESTVQDQAFSPRPDGSSTLQVEARDLTRSTVVVFDGITLPTEARGETSLVASVPAEFLTRPGAHPITVRNAQGDSNALEFVVAPKPIQAPVLTGLQPTQTEVGVGFNVQADGSSALTITGEHAAPGTTVMFDNIALPTTVQSEQAATAHVPAEFLSQAAEHTITLRNQSGVSEALPFVVVPRAVLPPVLRAVQPARTAPGVGFDVQADGASRLTLEAEHAVPGSYVTFDGVMLPTTVQRDTLVTAVVPPQFLAYPSEHEVRLHTPAGEAGPLAFSVTGAAGTAPVLVALDPPATATDAPFAVQPDGTSALRVEAEGVTPQTFVLWGIVSLPTRFVDARTLIASVPREFLAYPGQQPITLRNAAGDSNSTAFVIEP